MREEVRKEMTETEGKVTAKIKEIIKEEVTTMKQGMQKEMKKTKKAQSKGSEQTRGKRGKTRSRAAEARAATEAGKAMQAWDMTVTTMARLDTPATVARAVAAAIQLTAKVWNFEAADAVEAVS